jgi:hypothetical protein
MRYFILVAVFISTLSALNWSSDYEAALKEAKK